MGTKGIIRKLFTNGTQPVNQWINTRGDIFEHLPINQEDIVFIGDSLTEEFPVTEMFNNIHVKNRGIGYSTSTDIKTRFIKIASVPPQKIFLQVGLNDLRSGIAPHTVFENFKAMVKSVKPETKIIVQSLLPNGDNKFLKVIEAYNDVTKHYCAERNIPFIYLYTLFFKEGLNPAYTYDGTHLNGAGYMVWKRAIEGLV